MLVKLTKSKKKSLFCRKSKINAIAERPMLTRRPKAPIWLVHHHLRSLNTVNKGHYMKNMSIESV
jgi:hypothetical protein